MTQGELPGRDKAMWMGLHIERDLLWPEACPKTARLQTIGLGTNLRLHCRQYS